MGMLPTSISINDKTFICKTLVLGRPFTRTLITTKSKSQSQFSLSTKTSSSVEFSHGKTNSNSVNTVQFDDLHRSWNVKRTLFEKLKDKCSDPVRILEDDGDWSKELFWAVVGFLNQTSRSNQVLQVFDKWKSKDTSRISEFNYERIIRLLVEEGLVEVAVLGLREMKDTQGVQPSSKIYDSIIHGFAQNGRLEDALFYLEEMEHIQMKPHIATYNGLIKAYAKNGSYDSMAKCVKKMEYNGCFPDQSTYNLLIREFSRAGLIKRMERTYQIVVSKRMDLEAPTMVAMLEVYADFGILEKMEKVYRRVSRLKPKVYVKDDLIYKVAAVYIENYMFSKLDDVGINLCSKAGNTDIMWSLRMLSRACVLSRTGMESVVQKMDSKKVQWSVTVANTMLFAYAKMKDFQHLKVVLLEMAARHVKPDIVTCGILFDAHGFGELSSWEKIGSFQDLVELKTHPLVLVAFGKGDFLRIAEEVYSSKELDHKKSKVLTYDHLIKLVKQHRSR